MDEITNISTLNIVEIKEKIIQMVNQVENIWILSQILKFIINMTK